jgi:DNA polymerase
MTLQASLTGEIDLAGFRAEARQLLAHQVPPDAVQWKPRPPQDDELFATPQPPAASRPRSVAKAAAAIVPPSFLRLSEFVVLHREPTRFDLLYRLLWRLVHEPGLRDDPLDADMQHAQHMAHAVRRDIHKMKTQLRFRGVRPADGSEPLQLAWFDPTHHVVECLAPWFARRCGEQPWVILTPQRSVRWDRQRLHYGPGLPREQAPRSDAGDAAWLACVDQVFRPPVH